MQAHRALDLASSKCCFHHAICGFFVLCLAYVFNCCLQGIVFVHVSCALANIFVRCWIFGRFRIAPTIFMPLSTLSYTSLLGIISTIFVVTVMFIDGFSKPDSPGSLWSPAPTSIKPGTMTQVGSAFGLFMAGVSPFLESYYRGRRSSSYQVTS